MLFAKLGGFDVPVMTRIWGDDIAKRLLLPQACTMLGSPNVLVFKPRHVWTWLLTQKNKEKNTAAHTSEVLAGVACRIDTVSSVLTQKEENKRRQTKYILKPQPTWKGLFLSVVSCSVLLREQDDNDDARNGTVGVCVYVCVDLQPVSSWRSCCW